MAKVELEEDEYKVIGGKSYIHFSDYAMSPGVKLVKEKLFKTITAIIMRVVQSNGNVLIHCLAGEHDTAVIFGIMQKCYNKLPLEVIYKNTLCHLPPMEYQYLRDSYKILSQTIEDYPCSLLDQ